MLSNSCKYAIRAVIYLAMESKPSRKLGSKIVAERLNMPKPFLAKILQDLTRKNIISSNKGPSGGFYLTDDNLKTPVIAIVSCIDGLDKFNQCFLGLHTCSSEKPCSVHGIIQPFKNDIFTKLSENTIAQFAEDIRNGNSYISLD
ncbi:MAG: Rrf2 family transcriptional regulator [Flavobacteriaceae bacterium]|nr:Rrf2 family transcriptional regulator [Flavobacteriaceae bacterium]